MIEPEKVVIGGQLNTETRILEPTIMDNVSFTDPIMQDEIFGPILPVLTFSNIDKAIDQIKKLPKPLACYVFTGNNRIKKKILHEVSFGGGGVNETIMHITNSHLPFGGVGQSGIGSYHGINGFSCFSHYKSIIDKPNWFETNLKYYPHTPRKMRWIKRMFKF